MDERLLDLLLPRACAGCLEDLPPPFSGPLCGPCLLGLRALPDPLPRRSLPSLDLGRAAFRYGGPLARLLHAFKYGGSRAAGRALGDWMAGAAGRQRALLRADALVPVPLHPSKLRRRGFNQAELLARRLCGPLGAPVLGALERRRATRPQWTYPRAERKLRLLDAFRAREERLRGRRLLLIDDVCTSGGTLEGCARELRRAGAAWVGAFVLARG